MTDSSIDAVRGALAEARALGFLGPGDVGEQIEHALAFAEVVGSAPARFLDLGSGGGLPGLVLAAAWPSCSAVLLDGNRRRTSFLAAAVARSGLAGRVVAVRARAEVAAHDSRWRGAFPVVTARSFAPPSVTAECGAGFLAAGGVLVVSEPPQPDDRWPAEGLAELGLDGSIRTAHHRRFALLRRVGNVPDGLPRSWRTMERHPLF